MSEAEKSTALPDRAAPGKEIATLAGGCFWCLEAVFENLRGVGRVVSGYTGGTLENPGYRQVCSGKTGHAEAVRVVFDPGTLSYRDLLEVFFTIHDPTTLNRQGPDTGTQYRSAVYFHSPEQQRTVEETIAALTADGVYEDPVVTEVAPAGAFYAAEDDHQEFYRRNPHQPYCQMVVAPKVAKFRKKYLDRLKR